MIELFDSDTFFDTIGSDFEGILALYESTGIKLGEGYDRIIEDIDNEKLYIYHKKNGEVVFKLEDAPFMYEYIGRASDNTPLVVYETMSIKGRTYREKQAYLEELAKDWQRDFESHNYFWSDLAEASDYFRKNGKKYGLLTVFRDNGIC